MIYLTFDLETENYTLNKRKASPFDKRNYIVQIGYSVNGGERYEKYYGSHHRDPVMPAILDDMGEGDYIIGFNIKFDLLWVWGEKRLQEAFKRGVRIFDCQYAEYLLGGHTQEVQMTAMNDVAEKYGGGCKLDAVKEMWGAGHLTSDIPKDLLTDYLIGNGEIVGDVQNTWLIFLGQMKRMKEEHPKEFRTMFKFRMDGLLATTEMEYNGVFVDKDIGEKQRLQLIEDIAAAKVELEGFLPELPPELKFNWGSAQQKSCLIFGGTVKYKKWLAHTDENGNVLYAKKDEKWPLFQDKPIDPIACIKAGELFVLLVPENTPYCFEHKGKHYLAQDTYKSGKRSGEGKFKNVKVPNTDKPKGAQQDHYFTFKGYTKPHPSWKGESTDAYDNPLYSVGAKVIEKLAERGIPFTKALAKYTSMDKDLGTYYWTEDKSGKRKGMLTLLNDEGIIHHKINHTSTVTSRLSSSDPNLQNIPRGDTSNVKKMFKSRFGEAGKVAEIDYSQLEVVVQGVLSKDPQLMRDLNNGVDFHCKRLAAKLGEDYQYVYDKCHVEEDPVYKAARTVAKIFSFQRAYGAGKETIAASTGMPISEIEALIEAEEKLYPGVVAFDNVLEKIINTNRIPTANKVFINGVAFTQGESHWDSPTGTRYIWKEGITPEFMHAKGKYTGFSPTERKNYPPQGFGGEIVQTMLGILWRWIIKNNRFDGKVKLVNTVHDCVWLDGLSEAIEQVAIQTQGILESVPAVFNNAYKDINIEVPFPCETEIGDDMFDMHVI